MRGRRAFAKVIPACRISSRLGESAGNAEYPEIQTRKGSDAGVGLDEAVEFREMVDGDWGDRGSEGRWALVWGWRNSDLSGGGRSHCAA